MRRMISLVLILVMLFCMIPTIVVAQPSSWSDAGIYAAVGQWLYYRSGTESRWYLGGGDYDSFEVIASTTDGRLFFDASGVPTASDVASSTNGYIEATVTNGGELQLTMNNASLTDKINLGKQNATATVILVGDNRICITEAATGGLLKENSKGCLNITGTKGATLSIDQNSSGNAYGIRSSEGINIFGGPTLSISCPNATSGGGLSVNSPYKITVATMLDIMAGDSEVSATNVEQDDNGIVTYTDVAKKYVKIAPKKIFKENAVKIGDVGNKKNRYTVWTTNNDGSIASASGSDVFSAPTNGYAVWDAEKETLTLNDFRATFTDVEDGVYFSDDVATTTVIVAEGTFNSIFVSSNTEVTGIYHVGCELLDIQGAGTLSVLAESVSDCAKCICADGDIRFYGDSFNISAHSGSGSAYGISTEKSICIVESSFHTFEINSKEGAVGFSAVDNISISNSTFTDIKVSSDSFGIGVMAQDKNISVENTTMSIHDKTDGIFSLNGNIAIENSKVWIFDEGTSDAPNCIEIGLCALHAGKDLVIGTNSNIYASSTNAYGLFAGNSISITTDSDLTAYGGKGAVSATSMSFTGYAKVNMADAEFATFNPDVFCTYHYVVSNAQIALATYIVTFDVQGRGVAPTATTTNAGTTIVAPTPAPEAEGYTFGGWYKDASCTTLWVFETDTVSTNTTLYAKWTKNSYFGGGYFAPSGQLITSDLKAITKVTVDGVVVDAKYYTINGGNVTLSGIYLQTLTTGKHTVRLYNGDKAAVATITVNNGTVKSSKTGDMGVVLYGAMAVASLMGTGIVVGNRKRKEY